MQKGNLLMYPQAKDTSINFLGASSWHFTSFHDEDARSNNPQELVIWYSATFQPHILFSYKKCQEVAYTYLFITLLWINKFL